MELSQSDGGGVSKASAIVSGSSSFGFDEDEGWCVRLVHCFPFFPDQHDNNNNNNNRCSTLKHENGVHRVQRVPTTETQGRVHTSAMTVLVIPQPADGETDLKLNPADVKVETTKASGAGGQREHDGECDSIDTSTDWYNGCDAGRAISTSQQGQGVQGTSSCVY